MKLKKGDTVLIISGKDKGRTAKILKSLPKELKVLVEGINIKQKHIRPKKEGEKGQVIKIPLPMDVSNTKFLCPKCGKASRIGYKIIGDHSNLSGQAKKLRICKKCRSEI